MRSPSLSRSQPSPRPLSGCLSSESSVTTGRARTDPTPTSFPKHCHRLGDPYHGTGMHSAGSSINAQFLLLTMLPGRPWHAQACLQQETPRCSAQSGRGQRSVQFAAAGLSIRGGRRAQDAQRPQHGAGLTSCSAQTCAGLFRGIQCAHTILGAQCAACLVVDQIAWAKL